MDYRKFVELLTPKVAEHVDYNGRFPAHQLIVPRGRTVKDSEQEAAYVMDTYNYFFQRAILTCEQEAMKEPHSNLPRLLENSEVDRGRTILQQIRNNLTTFCLFQKDSPKIADAIVKLVGTCAGENGLPHYAQGAPLPPGFVERLVDFIFQEDQTAQFSCESMDFGQGVWKALKLSPQARQSFNALVSAYRDALVNDNVSHYNHLMFRGKTLSQHARESVAGELTEKYRKARDAYNGLRQVLRSKVLLSMVLEWLLHSAYVTVDEQPSVNDYEQDSKIETAILEGVAGKIAAPIKRPTPEERRKFSKSLSDNFKTMITAVTEPNAAKSAELIARLPNELQELAENLRKDEGRRASLSKVSGIEIGDDMQKAFFEATKMILLDVMCPVLYRSPAINLSELKRMVRQETMSAFLTAIFLSEGNEEAVRKIAEKHLEFFESKINKKTKEIKDVGQIQSVLLTDFVDLLCAPDLQQELQEGIKVLMECFDLRQELRAGENVAVAPVVVMRPHEGRDLLKQTSPDLEIVRVAVTRKVEKTARVQEGIAAVAATSSARSEAAGAAPAIEEGAVATLVVEQPEVAPSGDDGSDLDQKISSILSKIVTEDRRGATQDSTKELPLSDRVGDLLLNDNDFVKDRSESLKKFDKVLHLIYSRYAQHKNDKRTFRNAVERMTLLSLIIQFQDDLALGDKRSNLYRLLIDMVLHLDADKPDPTEFLREKSLTLYFDDADLANGGITELRQLLEIQAIRSLGNVEAFVSELRGVKYLLDAVGEDPTAEVVAVNATAEEFMAWLRADNLTPGGGTGRLRAGLMVTVAKNSEKTIPPGLVYLTDSAFSHNDKESWVRSLADFQMSEASFSVVIPPLLLSTGSQATDWRRQGEKIAAAAVAAPAPVIVLGPAPFLNRPDDGFKTILPPGYLLCAHFLGSKDQKIITPHQAYHSTGRARSIGRGSATMYTSLEQVMWGEGTDEENYCFAADYYLYLCAYIWATAMKFGGALPDRDDYFRRYFYLENDGLPKADYSTTNCLDRAVVGSNAQAFSMDQDVSLAGQKLESLSVASDKTSNLANQRTKRWTSKNIHWFNLLLERAGL
ncbi:hypothetical protein IV102_25585 [bacterium]|nr:hypothetical protein [bacterium]